MNIKKLLLVLSAVVLIAACTESRDPVEIVTEKAQARWDALVARDFAAAREYYTPGFRETTPEIDYRFDMDRRPVRWESAEVLGVECEENRCSAEVLVGYRIPSAPGNINNLGNSRPITEEWVEIDGDWWFVQN